MACASRPPPLGRSAGPMSAGTDGMPEAIRMRSTSARPTLRAPETAASTDCESPAAKTPPPVPPQARPPPEPPPRPRSPGKPRAGAFADQREAAPGRRRILDHHVVGYDIIAQAAGDDRRGRRDADNPEPRPVLGADDMAVGNHTALAVKPQAVDGPSGFEPA